MQQALELLRLADDIRSSLLTILGEEGNVRCPRISANRLPSLPSTPPSSPVTQKFSMRWGGTRIIVRHAGQEHFVVIK